MELKEQTCTREQGARLVKMGVRPDALFWHMPAKSAKHGEYIQYGWSGDALAPAFTVAELGNRPLCPDYMATWFAYDHWWWCDLRIENPYVVTRNTTRGYPTEAQARAAMIISFFSNENMQLPEACQQRPEHMEIVEQIIKQYDDNPIPGA